MRYAIRHETRFSYALPVRFARHNLRLKPILWSGQTLLDYSLTVEPGGEFSYARADASLANVTRLVVAEPVTELAIISQALVDVDRFVPIPSPGDPTLAEIAALARADRSVSAAGPTNYLFPSPMIAFDRAIADWCASSLDPRRGALDALFELACRIQADFAFDPDATKTETPPVEAFAKRGGVCQDFAQIMISGLRSAGLAAAYVSGYIRTIPPPGQERLVGADATHAWVLMWCGPNLGWVGVDPTNGIWMAGDHIATAIGRDYSEIAPIDGIFMGAGARSMRVSVDVEPLQALAPVHS